MELHTSLIIPAACVRCIACGSRARSAAALPPGRSPNASTACSSRTTRKHPLQLKKKSRRGEIKKIRQRVFLVGRSGRVRPQALGLSLHGSAAITLEIGSRFFVDGSHEMTPSCMVFFHGSVMLGSESPKFCESKTYRGFGGAPRRNESAAGIFISSKRRRL